MMIKASAERGREGKKSTDKEGNPVNDLNISKRGAGLGGEEKRKVQDQITEY